MAQIPQIVRKSWTDDSLTHISPDILRLKPENFSIVVCQWTVNCLLGSHFNLIYIHQPRSREIMHLVASICLSVRWPFVCLCSHG